MKLYQFLYFNMHVLVNLIIENNHSVKTLQVYNLMQTPLSCKQTLQLVTLLQLKKMACLL